MTCESFLCIVSIRIVASVVCVCVTTGSSLLIVLNMMNGTRRNSEEAAHRPLECVLWAATTLARIADCNNSRPTRLGVSNVNIMRLRL